MSKRQVDLDEQERKLSPESKGALQLDIAANRKARKWSRSELFGRVIWETIGTALFAISPRQCWSWRSGLLRAFGARIGRRVHLHPTVRIAIPWNLDLADSVAVGDRAILYNLGLITIRRDATISQHAHLCAGSHDHQLPDMPLTKPPIIIGEGAWICADAFIGPAVDVGPMAIVGARSVVVRSVPAGVVVAGNPARQIGVR